MATVDGTDTLTSIEGVRGGIGDDTLIGAGNDNLLLGGGGKDILDGLGGSDTLIGDEADATKGEFLGSVSGDDDTLGGGDGEDSIIGDQGSAGNAGRFRLPLRRR